MEPTNPPAPNTTQLDMHEPQPPKKGDDGVGPIVAIVVIVLILVLGGLYYLMQNVKTGSTDTAAKDQQTVQALMTQGSSDTAAAIQADLDATDLTSVDQAVADVDTSTETQ